MLMHIYYLLHFYTTYLYTIITIKYVGDSMKPEIDENLCVGCGHCAKRCPSETIVNFYNIIYVSPVPDCFECELCIQMCDYEAIRMVA